ncbi:MAG: hypothetical protein AB8I08_01040 [Sandaracinaceae bacterium]
MSLLTRYLSRIPSGWTSFPECRAKSVLFTRLVAMAERDWLPPQLVTRLDTPMLSTAWAPEVEQVALMLAIYDHRVHSAADEVAFHEDMLQLNLGLFKSPSYAPLVANAAPARLMRMMSDSWKLFHRGTSLDLREATPGRVLIDFRFPPLLYPEESIRTRTTSVRGALLSARAKGVQVHYAIEAPGHVCYEASWDS